MAPQPFVPLADGAQVDILMRMSGVVCENRLWFITRNPPITQQQLDDLVTGVITWHTGQILPFLSVDLRHVRVEARDWTADPPPFVSTTLTGLDGGNPDRRHSANVSVRIRFKGSSAQTFPSNSNFIPGIPLDAVNGNQYTTAFRDAMFNGYVNLIDLAGTFGASPGWRWVITSRVLNNAYRTEQAFARTDFMQFPSLFVSPRRKRLRL